MARPVVLVAWQPEVPEEALAVQEALDGVADVEWVHEVSTSLEAEVLPRVEALLVGTWSAWLTERLPRMRSLRLVQSVWSGPGDIPMESLQALPRRPRFAPPPERPPDTRLVHATVHAPPERVKRAGWAARQVAASLRTPHGTAL